MNNYLNSFVTAVVTFIATFIATSVASFVIDYKGALGISNPILIKDKFLSIISIENYSDEHIDGIAIEVPIDVHSSDLSSDIPLVISDVENVVFGEKKLLTFNKIAPRVFTRVFIYTKTIEDAKLIRVTNMSSSIKKIKYDEAESQFSRVVKFGFVSAVVYAFISGINFFYTHKRYERSDKKLKEAMEETKKLKLKMEELDKDKEDIKSDLKSQLIEARLQMSRYRFILQARIFDYSKELEFWRNTIKSLFLNSNKSTNEADFLISHVTEKLGTYGVSEKVEWESIRVAEAFLNNATKSQDSD